MKTLTFLLILTSLSFESLGHVKYLIRHHKARSHQLYAMYDFGSSSLMKDFNRQFEKPKVPLWYEAYRFTKYGLKKPKIVHKKTEVLVKVSGDKKNLGMK